MKELTSVVKGPQNGDCIASLNGNGLSTWQTFHLLTDTSVSSPTLFKPVGLQNLLDSLQKYTSKMKIRHANVSTHKWSLHWLLVLKMFHCYSRKMSQYCTSIYFSMHVFTCCPGYYVYSCSYCQSSVLKARFC